MKLYLLLFFLHKAQADIPISADIALPAPQYAETNLGAPRNPPYRKRPWLLIIPVGVVFFLGVLLLHRQSNQSPKPES